MNTSESLILSGPFSQLLSMEGLPQTGPVTDDQLQINADAGILHQGGKIVETGSFEGLRKRFPNARIEEWTQPVVVMPGMIDCHTHICFAGSRARDYAARNAGVSYLDIARAGGGIWSTVHPTREASTRELADVTLQRLDRLLRHGITTVEVKSGYGLSIEAELKMLRAINMAGSEHSSDVIPTCLAAHIVPRDSGLSESGYLTMILEELVPVIQEESLTRRFDIFIEESAFSAKEAKRYLMTLKDMGYDLTVHGDQFTAGGSRVAIDVEALSVDHLEASGEPEIRELARSKVIPVALPGASIGLGVAFTPARKLLDAGCSLAIASDWNPGSAPHGDLLTQAAILGTYEKLSNAEVLAGTTLRAADALGLSDRGILTQGMKADWVCFPGSDYQEILYQQGSLKPVAVVKSGVIQYSDSEL